MLSSEERSVAGFDSVDLTLSIPARILEAPDFGVTVSADSNLLPLITTPLEGSTLAIRSTRSIQGHLASALITVRMPAVHGLSVSGSGRLDADRLHPSGTLVLADSGSGAMEVSTSTKPIDHAELRLSGSGAVSLTTAAAIVDAAASGSGSATLSGSAGHAIYAVDGSGSIEAGALMAKDGDITVSGSGEVTISASGGTVRVSISGSGDVHMSGSSMAVVDRTGSGQFEQH
jgi:hypothetical protein